MKGFIEVTDYIDGFKILCPIGKILNVVCDGDGSVFIETGVDGKGESTGVLVRESYEEIKAKLKLSEV
jgi:hypothetical protein